jgi:N,N'-diacetyllegionaminate synthase
MKKEIIIGKRKIGPKSPVFIIAEAGSNHNGDLSLGKQLIDAAADIGADAVKFQKFTTEELVLPDAPKAQYQVKTTGDGENQYEMLKRLELSAEVFGELARHAEKRGILFFASVFDFPSVDFVVSARLPTIKIGSGDTNNYPLIRHVAKTGLPVLLSTGMSTLQEVKQAVDCVRSTGNQQLLLFHCVSSYPAQASAANLKVMHTLSKFGCPVGYSDHTPGIAVALASVALGAVSIEKHFTIDKSLPGPDHSMSMDPDEFRALVKGVREVEASLGAPMKRVLDAEKDILRIARKSLVARVSIPAGTVLKPEMIAIRRPAGGLEPKFFDKIVGKKIVKSLAAGQLFRLDAIKK